MDTEKRKTKAAGKYPGVAINIGDDNKDDAATIKERTKTLNNNPRNHK